MKNFSISVLLIRKTHPYLVQKGHKHVEEIKKSWLVPCISHFAIINKLLIITELIERRALYRLLLFIVSVIKSNIIKIEG